MKHVSVVVAVLVALSGCILVPAGHYPDGPGNSENAPGHNKSCGEGPGNSGSAPGQVEKNCR